MAEYGAAGRAADCNVGRDPPDAGEQSGCDREPVFADHQSISVEYFVPSFRTDSEHFRTGHPEHDSFGLPITRREFAESAVASLLDQLWPDAAGRHSTRRRLQPQS